MSILYSSLNATIEAALRFNVPFFDPTPSAPTRLLPQFRKGDVVEPTIYVVKGKTRQRYKLRSVAELWSLALGGDLEYVCGHFVELAWTNDSVRVELLLLPLKSYGERVTFQGTLNLRDSEKRRITGHSAPELSFWHDRGILLPPEAEEILESYKR